MKEGNQAKGKGFRIEYLGPKSMRMRGGEGFKMKNFLVCTVHLI